MPKRIITNILPSVEMTVAGPYDATNKLGNYDMSRSTIDRVIIHTIAGNAQAAADRFADLNANVSAHYGVRLDGTLIHWLEETYTAYHAGDYLMNQRSIGIEHEDNGDYNGVRPDILYATSAKLVADICQFYTIPIDRKHILKHSEVSNAPTGCPDALDIERIVRQAILIPPSVPTPAPTPIIPDYKQFSLLVLQIINGKAFAWDKVNGLKKLATQMGIK